MTNLVLTADIIDKIIVEGNRKVSQDTILFYMKSREKGLYSESMLKEDFNSLWKTGFFENISIETEDSGKDQKILRVRVQENPLISSITYKTGKKIKEKDIVEKLQQNNIALMPFSYYNPTKTKKIERIIREMLVDKGYTQGKVDVTPLIDRDQIALTITVEEGPKTRIGWITFPGLEKQPVSESFLRRGMKTNQAHNILSAIGGKDVYNKEKIDEDLEEVKLRLQEKGYLEDKVGKPTFSTERGTTIWGSKQEMLKLSIPVELGPRYKLKSIKIEGNKVIKTDYLYTLGKMKVGDIYNAKKRNDMVKEIQKVYGSLGYIYAQINPVENLDPVQKEADLTITIHEGEIAYVGKLEFRGNTFTKDRVIRREWFLREGGRLNMNALESSITRMKQLGLVSIDKMPDIKPDPQNPQKVDITAEVKELNRQQINFNVGYSGYDGWFISLGYSTQNFMGMGESLGVNFQNGTRSKNYSLSFTEPYLFNLANLGVSVHKTAFQYPGLYTRNGSGFNLSTAFRFLMYFGASLEYGYEVVEMTDVNTDYINVNDPYYYFYYSEGKRKISSLSPTIYYSTVDSPLFPTRGTKYLVSYRYSGGFLGGDVNMHKVRLQFVKFIPLFKRQTFGMQLVYDGIKKFGSDNLTIPPYELFFLGGEQSVRGFDIYTLGPRNEYGVVTGGNKSFYFNFEYQIPLNDQFSFNLFYDIGNAYAFGKPISFKDVYSSTGLELKIFIPMLNVPFRLILAYNPRLIRRDDSHLAFRFAVGPSFN